MSDNNGTSFETSIYGSEHLSNKTNDIIKFAHLSPDSLNSAKLKTKTKTMKQYPRFSKYGPHI